MLMLLPACCCLSARDHRAAERTIVQVVWAHDQVSWLKSLKRLPCIKMVDWRVGVPAVALCTQACVVISCGEGIAGLGYRLGGLVLNLMRMSRHVLSVG